MHAGMVVVVTIVVVLKMLPTGGVKIYAVDHQHKAMTLNGLMGVQNMYLVEEFVKVALSPLVVLVAVDRLPPPLHVPVLVAHLQLQAITDNHAATAGQSNVMVPATILALQIKDNLAVIVEL